MTIKEIREELNLPKRVLITGGMPYGNKPLHIGHIGAIFVWADVYARFMRDMLGDENVIFISGTDGFGSATEEKHRVLTEKGEINITLPEYIEKYHLMQKKTLNDYDISLNLFSASCIGRGYELHKQTSDDFFRTMYAKGDIIKDSSNQFYDTKIGKVLNGRQVEGKCPIVGCESETAYADECALGHQYTPNELIDPISVLSGTKPELKKVTNYYFKLEKYRELLKQYVRNIESNPMVRKFMTRDMKEFLLPPSTYISNAEYDKNLEFFNALGKPFFNDEKRNLITFTFDTVRERDEFCEKLNQNGIHFKNNKTLAPLRISGNIKWGVPLTKIGGEVEEDDLTFYVWPESLWAPISFTKQYLESINSPLSWRDWWTKKDSKVVQFIGEDNVYFYALAQTGMFLSMQDETKLDADEGQLQQSTVVANKHLLLGNMKASSSSKLFKAPTADELLEHYTVEQLRCHFISHNINTIASNFNSKVYFPEEFEKCGDPVVAQGNILTNVYNRIVRSVFYSLQEYFDGKLPKGFNTSAEAKQQAQNVLNEYVSKFKSVKLNEIMPILDNYFRAVNLNWANKSKIEDNEVRAQLIVDTIHGIKTGLLMLHHIAPKGAKLVAEYMNVDDAIFNWDNSEKTFFEIFPNINEFKNIPPKFDFFKKHQSQL